MYTSSIIKEERTVCRAYEQHLIDKVLGRIVKKKKAWLQGLATRIVINKYILIYHGSLNSEFDGTLQSQKHIHSVSGQELKLMQNAYMSGVRTS